MDGSTRAEHARSKSTMPRACIATFSARGLSPLAWPVEHSRACHRSEAPAKACESALGVRFFKGKSQSEQRGCFA